MHTSACKVKDKIADVHIDDSGEVIPVKRLRIVHEEKRDKNGKRKEDQRGESSFMNEIEVFSVGLDFSDEFVCFINFSDTLCFEVGFDNFVKGGPKKEIN